MARAYICDRCGALIEQDKPAWRVYLHLADQVTGTWRWRDLTTDKTVCQGCAERVWERQFLEPPVERQAARQARKRPWWMRLVG